MKNYSKIVLLVDRSGSMESIKEATVAGINSFIRIQKEKNTQGELKIVQFDSPSAFYSWRGSQQIDGYISYDVVRDGSILDCHELKSSEFEPRGGTPLLDAVGKTIEQLGNELRALPEAQRPEHVIVCIVTDGEENSSRKFTHEQIKQMIEHQTTKYNWDFTYIGANQDAFKVGASIGVLSNKTMTYTANAGSTISAFASMGNYANTVSCSIPGTDSVKISYSQEDIYNAQQ